MKQRLKGLLALVLSLVMVLSMVTVSTASQPSDSGSAPTTYPVSIGGVVLTSDNISSYAGIRFTPTDGTNPATLTLNNFTYSGDRIGISATEDLTIKLIGENNTITTTSDKGISVIGNLTIEGSNGKVKATGEKYGIFADKGSHSSGGMKVTISGGSVEAYATDGSDGIGIYAPGGEIAISGDNTQVTVGCATGLQAKTVNILENSTVNITTNATTFTDGKTIDCTNLYFDADTSKLGTWYQWSENGGSVNISSNTNQLTVDAAKGVQTLTIEKISTGGTGTTNPTPPSIYYPIAPTTPEPEGDKVTSSDTFDGGIASAVVVTILSATGGAWLAKKKD